MAVAVVNRSTVTNRAKRLLESFLSEEQRRDAELHGFFHEPLPDGMADLLRPSMRYGFLFETKTGSTYIAAPRPTPGSYYPFGTDKWQAVQRICLVPRISDHPQGMGYAYDMILAVLLAVRTDIVRFFKHIQTCGHYHGDNPCPARAYREAHPGY
jgi:hypothetical protein